jgi:hypothetical protein
MCEIIVPALEIVWLLWVPLACHSESSSIWELAPKDTKQVELAIPSRTTHPFTVIAI